jgi:hypothetical protein
MNDTDGARGRLFGTRDFYLAATLVCLGMEMKGLDRTDPRRVVFLFEDHPQRHVWARAYFAGDLRVNPLNFAASIRALKGELYAAR